MKKSDFYLRYKNSFHRVSGYIGYITDKHGNKVMIGYHNIPNWWWVATHIESGLYLTHGKTRKECIDKVNDEEFLKDFRITLLAPYIAEYVSDMSQFLKNGVVNE